MSPVTSINDHLTFNIHQQPNMTIRSNSTKLFIPNSRSDSENLHMLTKRKSHPFDEQEQTKRRFTVTNISIPETIRNCSVDNQVYDNSMIRKSSTTQNISVHQQPNPKFYQIPSSNMDFRPLITNGRRKFGTIPSSSSMIIIKKKSPSPMNNISYNHQRKPLIRSIPVNIINSNIAMAGSSMIPSSLSYSSSYSSSSSTSASSTNAGTVFLPIQVTKSQNNNNNNNNNYIQYITNTSINEGQTGYRYVQKPIEQQKSFAYLNTGNRIQLDDDLNQSTRIPLSSSNGAEGHKYKSTILMDSNVLRLIRRYDPVNPSTTGFIPRRSLEKTRGVWHTVASKTSSPQPSDSSPFLSRRSLTTTYEDEIPKKQTTTPRLQRQEAIHESEAPPPPVKTIRPILKYASARSRSEFIVQPHQTEPLTIQIDPYISSLPPNESPATYQPLITTGTKRVCSALSKSEWDLRLQQEQLPIRPPSPSPSPSPSRSPIVINQQQEKESYRPTLGRSKSSVTINHTNNQDDDIDDFDENSAPIIIPSNSYVEKLKQLFVTKLSHDLTNQHRNDSIDSNLNRHINPNNQIIRSSSIIKTTPIIDSIESQPRIINKPTTIIQEVTPIYKKPIFRSQKTIDSPESVIRPNNSIQMPSSDLSYDAYRFRRLNDQDSITTRPRNIAKVEPYLMNTNTVRPLYQSSQPIMEPTGVTSKARINLNSMGNTPVNSSTSSSAGSLGGMIRHSDFLMSNPAYSKPPPPPQPLSNSSSSYTTPPMLLSESLSHGSLHQLPVANIPSYNGHITGLSSLNNNSQEKYQSVIQGDFHSSMHTSSPSLNNNNYIASSPYHYQPIQTNGRQQPEIPIRSTTIEQQQQQDDLINSNQQQQSRRRFQRRKQMKRSKSVDSYQEPSAFISPTINNDLNKSDRPQRSISREYLDGGEILSSSSSSSSSLTVDIERVNRAALLRYKSLDSITHNNRKSNLNGRNINNNRRIISKPAEFDFDSDDSVCGIPKPRKTIGL